ncbi:MAG: heme ABC transporter ATP-binding protein [Bacteroidia bacterium]
MLSLKNISYEISKTPLLKNIFLEFQAGEFITIMGPNGAGKSTLLKVMAASIFPSTGEILMNDKSLNKFPKTELAKMRAVLSQHYEISFPITVEEIVLMGRYPYYDTIVTAKDKKICAEMLEKMGVQNLSERDYNTLSGGEMQKVQMARILAQLENEEYASKILFLDEPVSSLDINYQHFILKIAQSLAKKNILVIAVLHDINLASQYADKIVMMKNGEIVANGKPATIITPELLFSTYGIKGRMLKDDKITFPYFIAE